VPPDLAVAVVRALPAAGRVLPDLALAVARALPEARRAPVVAAVRSACPRAHRTVPRLITACRLERVRTAVIS